MSLHFHRTPTTGSTAHTPTRISLVDNTVPPLPSRPQSPSPSSPGESPTTSSTRGDGKRDTLRKAIAERRYKRWSANLSEADAAEAKDGPEETLDEGVDGVVVERDADDGKETPVATGGDDGSAAGDGAGDGRRDAGGGTTTVPKKRRKRNKGPEIAEIDVLYENQRGSFICGIPLFSSKSLLNFDPSAWQNAMFHNSAVSIVNAQVPDPSWVWAWKSWYVDMTADVDEEGWGYSFSFSPAFAWHGNHVWFHSFVRRRRWLRKRIKATVHPTNSMGNIGGDESSKAGSVERAGHGLNNDYFTIHSRKDRNSWYAGGSHRRRSVLEGSDWGGNNESDEEVELKDVATLMQVVKKARLDREKIEAVMKFVEDGGEEIAYLADKISTLMGWMVFQASRRQLLAHLINYTEQYEAGEAPVITMHSPPSPVVSDPLTPTSSQNPLMPKEPTQSSPLVQSVIEGKSPNEDEPTLRRQKIENLKNTVNSADQEVKKMEFWSDVKDVARKGESFSAEAGEQGWRNLGISGASMGNEKALEDARRGDVPEAYEQAGTKGKGKEAAW